MIESAEAVKTESIEWHTDLDEVAADDSLTNGVPCQMPLDASVAGSAGSSADPVAAGTGVLAEEEGESEEDQLSEAERISAIEAEIAEVREQRKKLQHDFEKFQHRSEEQRAQWAERARKKALEASLTVYDDLHRWLDAAPMPGDEEQTSASLEALKDGAELVSRGLAGVIARFATALPPLLAADKVADTAEVASVDEEATPCLPEMRLEQERVKLRRAAAAYRAYTRRVKVRRNSDGQHAQATVAVALQKVLEALRASLDAIGGEDVAELSAGYEMLEDAMVKAFEAFSAVLNRFEVSVMEVLERPFEVEQHEAVGQAPAPDKEPGTVIYEVRRGYMYRDQVLRYAQVIVAA